MNIALKYAHNNEKIICTIVSNVFPFQVEEEYPKN